jgi:hypothetical protein
MQGLCVSHPVLGSGVAPVQGLKLLNLLGSPDCFCLMLNTILEQLLHWCALVAQACYPSADLPACCFVSTLRSLPFPDDCPSPS